MNYRRRPNKTDIVKLSDKLEYLIEAVYDLNARIEKLEGGAKPVKKSTAKKGAK